MSGHDGLVLLYRFQEERLLAGQPLVQGKIRNGGQGKVVKLYDAELGKYVAAKYISYKTAAHPEREAVNVEREGQNLKCQMDHVDSSAN